MSMPNRSDATFVSPHPELDRERAPAPFTFRLSRDLIGMKVVSSSGDHLGRIEDLVVHPGSEQSYVVLSFGGWLGVGDKYFAMPWSVLKPGHQGSSVDHGERSLVLPLDRERLKSAPGFDKSSWPSLANANWTRDVNAFYAGHSNPNTHDAFGVPAKSSTFTWRLADLEDTKVTTADGTKLGDIEGLAIDSDGRVGYAAVSVGGFLGLGERKVAVPWSALTFTPATRENDERRVTMTVTKQQLENAPLFEDGMEHASTMCDPAWIAKVHEHFSCAPYWASSAQAAERGPTHAG